MVMASIPRLPTVMDEVLLYTGPPWLLVMYGVLNALDGRYCTKRSPQLSLDQCVQSEYYQYLSTWTHLSELHYVNEIKKTTECKILIQNTMHIKNARLGTHYERSFKNVETNSSSSMFTVTVIDCNFWKRRASGIETPATAMLHQIYSDRSAGDRLRAASALPAVYEMQHKI